MARILVVEDDRLQRSALVTMLRRAGHEPVEAEDGQVALDLARETQFDVVVTDLQLPLVHGLELIAILRDFSPRPQIVAVSGTGPDQLAVAEAVGADATLVKPIFPDRLLGAVDETLAGEGGVPTLVVSDPPHRSIDLEAASALIGLDVFQTRLKFEFQGPEVLAASDRRRACELASTFGKAGIRSTLIDGAELSAVPWPAPVSSFSFTDEGLAVTVFGRDLALPYDTDGVAIFCSPPADFPAQPPSRTMPEPGEPGHHAGRAAVERLEWIANLDLYVRLDGALRRVSIAGGGADFSGLRGRRARTTTAGVEAMLAECKRRFSRMRFDTRLTEIRPRRRFTPGDDEAATKARKRYSFGTPVLRETLASISPELADLTHYELGSRLGYLTSRNRPPDWRSQVEPAES